MSDLGPTGKFPRGKLNPSDEGEIRMAVFAKEGNVVIDFGKKIRWLAFPPEMIDGLVDILQKQAARAARQR